jgi:hypothetical protein
MCKVYPFLLAILIMTLSSPLFAQQDTLHRISVAFLGGSSVTTIGVYEEADMNIIGFTGGVRLLWEPEKLLRIGIEGGLLHLAHSKEENIQTDFGMTRRSNSLNAYPVLLHFSMKVWKLELMLGLGAAVVSSKINAFDDVSESSVITSARMFGVAYSMPLTEWFRLGCEYKYYAFSTPELTVGTIQLTCKYSLLVW